MLTTGELPSAMIKANTALRLNKLLNVNANPRQLFQIIAHFEDGI